ncbi:uncharacterized protein LOC131033610 [Cryptomeria japonica]|uniref:uncharacterized protein LOC131033610 n=1 Tax=Cryptomeria japonica TaxID=3369 RepID=UPI0027DAB47C|nr:uncharacterized protein LOC131033610 [Cryptomeria japonica]
MWGVSRVVIAERRGNEIVEVDISSDHTPFRVDEFARVKSCGARVMSLYQIEVTLIQWIAVSLTHGFFVIANDGVFEFLCNKSVLDMVTYLLYYIFYIFFYEY